MSKDKPKAKTPKKLTHRQENFINEYLIDLNATQAAIRAGYSKNTAKFIGYENLTKPYIETAIRERREQLTAKQGVTQEKVIKEYARIAFLDPSEFFNSEGKLIPLHELSKDVVATIAGMDHVISRIGTGDDSEIEHTKKIKICDKLKALDSLARHLGLFEKDNEQKQGDALVSLLEKISTQGPPKPKGDDAED